MKHKIFYFSGTGNTLYAARKFAAALGDTELVSISDLPRGEDVVVGDAETCGIFCPVYCFGIPHIVHDFLKRIRPDGVNGSTYMYALCTSGGMIGAASAIIEDMLAEKGIRLTAVFHVVMPSCYLPLSAPPNTRRREKVFARAERAVAEAVEDLKAHKRTRPLRIFPIDTLGKFVAGRAVSYLQTYDRYFWTDDRCDGCGLCTRICPSNNITIDAETHRPLWHGHCEQCMSCIQFCPKQALQFRKVSLKRQRYHHPDVTAVDIAGARNSI